MNVLHVNALHVNVLQVNVNFEFYMQHVNLDVVAGNLTWSHAAEASGGQLGRGRPGV